MEEKQEAQKTLVAFIVGLLIGGMLVWAFSGPTATAPIVEETENEVEKKSEDKEVEEAEAGDAMEADAPAQLNVGEGKVRVPDQEASASIKLDSATYPVSEGWIGVRDYNNDQLGMILGVVRFSEEQGLIPSDIVLQRPTRAGNRYAVVVFNEDGDRKFNLAGDSQIDTIFDTFVAK